MSLAMNIVCGIGSIAYALIGEPVASAVMIVGALLCIISGKIDCLIERTR